VGEWSRPTPTATVSKRAYAGLRGADGFALLDLDEAGRVRALGWRGPILLLEGAFEPRDLETCSRLQQAHRAWRRADRLAGRAQDARTPRVLKLNSGMNRLGFSPDALRSAGETERRRKWADLADDALPTPMGSAVSPGAGVFRGRPRAICPASGPSNSAATLRHASAAAWRPTGPTGHLLYGSADYPQHDIARWELRPSMPALAADRGAVAGRGCLRRLRRQLHRRRADAHRHRRLRYADGYPRSCPPARRYWSTACARQPRPRVDGHAVRGPARHRSGRARHRVTLAGRGSARAAADRRGRARSSTIGYELMCALAQRVPVRVVD
jgi:alanine racemase